MMMMMMSEIFDVVVVEVVLCLLFMDVCGNRCVLFDSGLLLWLWCWYFEGETREYFVLFMLRTRDLG